MRNVNRKMIAGSMVLVLCLAMVVAFAGCKDKAAVAENCAPDCTKPCCADKEAKACCGDEEAGTCCAADTAAKTCGPDCTKPCCADKDLAKCPPDCTKPCCAGKDAVEAVEKVVQSTTNTAEQTTCPVMGGKINKDVSVEYEGKKVYFCCGGCDDKFLADPEKYIAKLPQFSK